MFWQRVYIIQSVIAINCINRFIQWFNNDRITIAEEEMNNDHKNEIDLDLTYFFFQSRQTSDNVSVVISGV